jgi:hypothetical protein
MKHENNVDMTFEGPNSEAKGALRRIFGPKRDGVTGG